MTSKIGQVRLTLSQQVAYLIAMVSLGQLGSGMALFYMLLVLAVLPSPVIALWPRRRRS